MEARIGIREIAKAAGVSKSTVGYALKNQPQISRQTREHVLSVAKELGYVPDARVASWMATVREAASKDLQPIAWINTNSNKEAWHTDKFLSPYMEGANEFANQSGYRFEEIWADPYRIPMRRVSTIVYQRGIRAAIITQPVRHFRLRYEHLAAVGLEGALLAPRLDKVCTDVSFNFSLALKRVQRAGYQRIGIFLADNLDRYSGRSLSKAVYHFNSHNAPDRRVEPLFYLDDKTWEAAKREATEWVHREKPDALIVHANWMVELVESLGFRVPEEIGVVHLAIDDDVADWAGVYSNRRKIGATAAQLVVSRLQNGQFGVPDIPTLTFVRGSWSNGRTLLVPKPK